MKEIDKKSGLFIANYFEADVSLIDLENQNIKYVIRGEVGTMEFEVLPIDLNFSMVGFEILDIYDDIDSALKNIDVLLLEKSRMNIILDELKEKDDAEMISIDIDLDKESLAILKSRKFQLGINKKDLLTVFVVDFLLSVERDKFKDKFKSIVTIHEVLSNTDLLSSQKEDTLVLVPNGKHFVIVPKSSDFFDVLNTNINI